MVANSGLQQKGGDKFTFLSSPLLLVLLLGGQREVSTYSRTESSSCRT